MPLSPRLRAVLALVPPGSRVADVGADHARLTVALLAGRVARRVIATEIDRLPTPSPAAVARAGRRLELRAGAGLGPLGAADRLDVVVLAGMGARTMLGVLEAAPLRRVAPRRLVLQPQSETVRLRDWARSTGRAIVDERGVLDRGRWYEALAIEAGGGPGWAAPDGLADDDVLAAGPVLLRRRDPAVLAHWRGVAAYRRRIAARAGDAAARLGVAQAERIADWLACYTRPPS